MTDDLHGIFEQLAMHQPSALVVNVNTVAEIKAPLPHVAHHAVSGSHKRGTFQRFGGHLNAVGVESHVRAVN